MADFNGTENGETINGTSDADEISGEGGDDTINGGDGDDALHGGFGNDIVRGEGGNDTIDGGMDDDQLYGGAGNDTILDMEGNDLLDGGDGDDEILLQRDDLADYTVTVIGGAGNDYVDIHVGTNGSTTIDLGLGDDELWLVNLSINNSITLGGGRDKLVLFLSYQVHGAVNVTDFTAGDTGDVLELKHWLPDSWSNADPLAGGFITLQQQGADTLVMSDVNGTNPGQAVTLFVLENVTATELTAANFGYVAPVAPTIEFTYNGTPGDDTYNGDARNEEINGLGGNDTLSGGDGHDTINGGDGDDTITDTSGHAIITGGAGNDTIDIIRGFGRAGEDVLIVAGTGNDVVTLDLYTDTGTLAVDLGAGDDTVNFVKGPAGSSTFTLRAGRDTIVLDGNYRHGTTNTITDFTPGASGDIIDTAAFLQVAAFDWDPTTNPFTNGFLVLEQRGNDVVLVVNRLGDPSNSTFTYDLFLFQNTTIGAFTPENFAGFNPDGSPPAGIVFDGTPGDDTQDGAGGNDTLRGNEGNDTLNGLSGDDLIEGGAGNDTLDGGRGDDTVRGGDGDDYIFEGAGTNLLDGGEGNDTIELGYLSGSLPVGQTTTILGGGGHDIVKLDYAAGQSVVADLGTGDDRIEITHWPEGLALTLGSGVDTIDLKPVASLPHHLVTVSDFTPGAGGDKIQLLDWAQTLTNDPSAHYNPFSFLDVAYVQVGVDTHLQFRGATFMVLQNVTAANLTIDNFDSDPFAPEEPGVTLAGTPGIDNLEGTRRADSITGLGGDDGIFASLGDDFIDAGGGNDEIYAGGGNDTIIGGLGNDEIYGEGGTDDIDAGGGDDVIYYSDSSDLIDGGAGFDRLDFVNITDRGLGGGAMNFDLTGFLANGTFLMGGNVVTGIEELFFFEFGTVFADRVVFDATQTTGVNFQANGGNDEVLGTAGADTLLGNDGNDILRGKGGADHLEGGAGDDLLDGGIDPDFLLGGTGNDTLLGGSGADELWGDAGNDRLEGQDGNDMLYAGEGEDTLLGGAGDDFLEFIGFGAGDSADGGTGTDTLRFTSVAGQAVNLDLQNYWTGGVARSNGVAIALTGIEKFDFTFTDFDDTLHYGFNAPEAINVETLGGNDTVTGTGFADTINVGNGNNVVNGLGGDDIIRATNGANVIRGGAGNDDIHGGGTLFGEAGNDHILGWTGNDTIDGGIGNDWLSGGQGDDLFLLGANAGIDTIDGSFGTDTIRVEADGVTIHWNSLVDGNSTVLVTGIEHINANGHANVSIVGTSGNDQMIFSQAFGGPTTTISESILIDAGGGDDRIVGSSSNDTIVGGAGNDDIDGWVGADRLSGGLGDDWYRVDNAGDLVFENAGEGSDTVFASVGHYLFANVEVLRLTGNGNIFGVGNELANDLYGNSGDNLLIAGAGNDFVSGGDGNDALFGQDGADRLAGGNGIDYLVGGNGNDILFGEGDADALYGEAGDDFLDAGAGFVTDILVGGDGNDVLYAISGLGEYDLLDGGAGDDKYYVDTGDDLTFEAVDGGIDTVYADIQGANSGVYLYANVENLVLEGTTTFGVGNELDNIVIGNGFDNVLLGGAGNDTINAGGGLNILFGQEGADTFEFTGGADIIGDFTSGEDRIDLSALGITSFAQLQGAFVQVDNIGAIDLGGFGLIILHDVQMADLTADDFIL